MQKPTDNRLNIGQKRKTRSDRVDFPPIDPDLFVLGDGKNDESTISDTNMAIQVNDKKYVFRSYSEMKDFDNLKEMCEKSSENETKHDLKAGTLSMALNPKAKTAFRLHKKEVISDDSFLLDFAFDSPKQASGLPTGKHVLIYANINGKTVIRAYTPISSNRSLGHLKFVTKAYRPCENFPDGGLMSQYWAFRRRFQGEK